MEEPRLFLSPLSLGQRAGNRCLEETLFRREEVVGVDSLLSVGGEEGRDRLLGRECVADSRGCEAHEELV